MTVVTALIIPLVLADNPETANFLTEEVRLNMVRLRQAEVGQIVSDQDFAMKDAVEAVSIARIS